MDGYSIQFYSLTPIFTGNSNQEGNKLRETGIIGSIRWWYEALIRAIDGKACDPTDSKCDKNAHCHACELFGCTGWARKFKLIIKDTSQPLEPSMYFGARKNNRARRNVTGVMIPKTHNSQLIFIPLRNILPIEWKLLNKTLEIIENYGAIGARTSQGNGVIKITKNIIENSSSKITRNDLEKYFHSNNVSTQDSSDQPNLKNFFFYKFRISFNEDITNLIKENEFWINKSGSNNYKVKKKLIQIWEKYSFLPIAFHVRDALRREGELDKNKKFRHYFFGKPALGSKVFVSHGYKCEKCDNSELEIRIWGYNLKNDKIDIEEKIKTVLLNKHTLEDKLFSKPSTKNRIEVNPVEQKSGEQIIGEV